MLIACAYVAIREKITFFPFAFTNPHPPTPPPPPHGPSKLPKLSEITEPPRALAAPHLHPHFVFWNRNIAISWCRRANYLNFSWKILPLTSRCLTNSFSWGVSKLTASMQCLRQMFRESSQSTSSDLVGACSQLKKYECVTPLASLYVAWRTPATSHRQKFYNYLNQLPTRGKTKIYFCHKKIFEFFSFLLSTYLLFSLLNNVIIIT